MEGGGFVRPTVDDVFKDFKSRRAGLIKALTTDHEEFYQQCDPDRDKLCLYGWPNETWEVNLPVEELPPELPEPALGINFARDRMHEKDWLSLVAVHSDSWLLAVSLHFGARFGFDKNDRKRLFNMMNKLPTIYEVVTGTAKNQVKERSTVDGVFNDFKGLRAGLIKALTTDHEEFYQQCDPYKGNLCLYGSPNEKWEVNLPAEKVLAELPEPALGINYARDGMHEKDWLSLAAIYSDSWLRAVSFYIGARFGFDKNDRKRLFNMMNELSTIYDVVTACGYCDGVFGDFDGVYSSATAEFWIACDMCRNWFHGKCVNITPARAAHIKQYECPSCSNERARALFFAIEVDD